MGNYYSEKLGANSLVQVYDTDLPRVSQYLKSEIDFVRDSIKGKKNVLELGCGYGRIMKELAPCVEAITGIDLSAESVELAKSYLSDNANCRVIQMDAMNMDLPSNFDAVLCLQNGLSAISSGSPFVLMEQCLQKLLSGGKAYFSTYSSKFWDDRVAWFREQANKGLLGQLDEELTKDGNIVCVDGFRATTYSENDLIDMANKTGYPYKLIEIDQSSLFLIVERP